MIKLCDTCVYKKQTLRKIQQLIKRHKKFHTPEHYQEEYPLLHHDHSQQVQEKGV